MESLLLDSLEKEIDHLENEISYIRNSYDDINTLGLSAQLGLFCSLMTNKKVQCFEEILQAVKELYVNDISAICEVMININLLNVNLCSSATGEILSYIPILKLFLVYFK